MYQLEFDNLIRAEHGILTFVEEEETAAPASSWDDLLTRAATIALASRTNHHIVAFDLLLEEPAALRDFMQQEFQAHPEELLE
jgi:hypothetical protein